MGHNYEGIGIVYLDWSLSSMVRLVEIADLTAPGKTASSVIKSAATSKGGSKQGGTKQSSNNPDLATDESTRVADCS